MNSTIETSSFKSFLLKDRWNKRWLWISALALILQFTIFKFFYPFASYIHGDSFVYLDTAYYNKSINTYMIGYSMFLRAFSVFSTSDIALTAFQYILISASALFLLFTLFYLYSLTRTARSILIVFTIFNPLFIYLGNLISSDNLFLSLSLIWFALMLWTIHRPNLKTMIFCILTLFFAFTVRYNALTYLLITILSFILSKQAIKFKILGIGGSIALISIFIINTGNHYKTLTGLWEYSPFAGWQWANNAMYAYRYVDKNNRKPVPKKFEQLDIMVRQYFDSTRDTKKHPEELQMASTMYMWSPGLTLFKYRDSLFGKNNPASELKKWATMGPYYKEYGLFIIKQYPYEFLRYFIWPNAIKYYAPPVEFLEQFNSGQKAIAPIAQLWFKYKSNKIYTKTPDIENKLLSPYPILSGTINAILLLCFSSYLLLAYNTLNQTLGKGIAIAFLLWLTNAIFTISASSAALRFQSFPLVISFYYCTILVDWLVKMAITKPTIQYHFEHLIAT